jgi:RNA-directed DNA polymerase
VKKVVTNRGKNTPGIDGELWSTEKERTEAIDKLKESPYVAKPLKRIYVPKPNGKKRPISIPCMIDRATQALHALALDPIAEATSDVRSYGYRKYKKCQDALKYCFNIVNGVNRASYVLEGDIKGCFDNISHKWVLENVPMNKSVLKQFLKAGYIESETLFKTEEGVPQGGVISPIIANIVLTGLEEKLRELMSNYPRHRKDYPKVNYVRYADDFIITGATPEFLKEKVLPLVELFLKERGLTLSNDKTRITPLTKGFDFLGVTFRTFKDEGKKAQVTTLHSPSKKSVTRFKEKIREAFRKLQRTSAGALINKLNPIIRGWANYFQTVSSKSTFTSLDHYIFQKVWIWACRKHPNLTKQRIKDLYFRKDKGRDWILYSRTQEGEIIQLLTMAKFPILKYRICKDLNPYLSSNKSYYLEREASSFKYTHGSLINKLIEKQKGYCPVCEQAIVLG